MISQTPAEKIYYSSDAGGAFGTVQTPPPNVLLDRQAQQTGAKIAHELSNRTSISFAWSLSYLDLALTSLWAYTPKTNGAGIPRGREDFLTRREFRLPEKTMLVTVQHNPILFHHIINTIWRSADGGLERASAIRGNGSIAIPTSMFTEYVDLIKQTSYELATKAELYLSSCAELHADFAAAQMISRQGWPFSLGTMANLKPTLDGWIVNVPATTWRRSFRIESGKTVFVPGAGYNFIDDLFNAKAATNETRLLVNDSNPFVEQVLRRFATNLQCSNVQVQGGVMGEGPLPSKSVSLSVFSLLHEVPIEEWKKVEVRLLDAIITGGHVVIVTPTHARTEQSLHAKQIRAVFLDDQWQTVEHQTFSYMLVAPTTGAFRHIWERTEEEISSPILADGKSELDVIILKRR